MKNNQYKTKDLAEAAALIVEGLVLSTIERQGNTCWFIFEDDDECRQLSQKFFFGGLLVDARQYYEAMGRLKNRIFSA